MDGKFKQCPKGHYYQGESCPFCKTRNEKMEPGTGTSTGKKTEVYVTPDLTLTDDPAPVAGGNADTGLHTTTVFINEQKTSLNPPSSPAKPGTCTVFDGGSETIIGEPGNKTNVDKPYRTERKLVGWLVSYTLDEMGVDFKLYEGRNIIGRDVDCNITVQDPMMSGKHAVLLFRANKYSLTDTQSSHGTFVNESDIELEPCYLNDGDVIRMGRTVFKFRTSF